MGPNRRRYPVGRVGHWWKPAWGVEAAFLHRQGDTYYLFTNWYGCCAGVDSTYAITVGRSDSPTGPFVDADGVDMRQGGGERVLDGSSGRIGPGHTGIFSYTGPDGQHVQVMSFHHYPADGVPWATLETRTLSWTADGWPVVSDALWDPSGYW